MKKTKSHSGSSYQIAIPSYRRSQLIGKKTLATLSRHSIPPSCITIFVANQTEYDIYTAAIPANLYHKIVIGDIGLRNQRNFITRYYPAGTHLVQMDDDLDEIVILQEWQQLAKGNRRTLKKQRKLIPIPDLNQFITNAFALCQEKNIYLWGIYPVANSYFMSPIVRTDLQFIVGPFWGCINRHNSNLAITLDEKENVERSLLYYTNDRGVIRFDYVSIITKYYKTPGGMQNSQNKNKRKRDAATSASILHKRYPNLTKIKTRKNGRTEIVFKQPKLKHKIDFSHN
jgi:hypothetical protein